MFDTRRFDREESVILWADVHPLWGGPLLLCIGVTLEGQWHVLGFVESSVQDLASIRGLFQDLLGRELSPDQGLL
ncbi:MAG: hypothetical protein F4058_04870 [Rhodothermaceae bacterium]|nr:hypothetical protein [Rhodothermaceae bacterium]MYI84653.1 hypothetical protein [Rhodothermaceae bacterium]